VAFDDDLIAQYRKNSGVITEGPFTGRDLLLLTTTGATSGHSRTHPIAYTRDGDRYLIIASNDGAPSHPAWYHNLRTHPEVTVEVGPEKFRAKAIAFPDGPERRRLYDQMASVLPGFKEYEIKTKREIPTVLLERLPDESTGASPARAAISSGDPRSGSRALPPSAHAAPSSRR